ncbi:pyridoxal phosphate-dependent aminotransferase [Lutispora saccharofermentans]|uniref:Aminotransferase class I/II-fold pyridoxal phosphate-dependent enzyme n=1 Tax=Lutispora saccharofermentans TaxID=3024236 RepID=A0ABT1NAV6_9FIRM|nr:aminotransferase class I/II-fold pyridoxal phosphate-dependent enzyme [Lutispora saccharofermentans]MCQ1528189.1 aminotransferase class I/II-fold pyridoxal phosphate-dependent enzyme [Lutispora saccharofermentans]
MNFHGGNIYNYKNIRYDFSANINPLGVPDSFKKALMDDIDSFTRYPDIRYADLKDNIRSYINVPESVNILVGNGAVEIIYSILGALDAHKLFTIGPTFSEYKKAALNNRIEYDEVFAYNQDFSKIDIDSFLDRVEKRTAVLLCNPNNPTGFLLDKLKLEQIASKLGEKQCILIIDEAFIEFTDDYPNSSFVSKLLDFPNTIVIRAATKFFGMPGIRLGYALTCNDEVYKRINDLQHPWNVNTGAVIAASCIFSDKEYIINSHEWIKSERDFLYKGLSNFESIEVYPSRANFHLLRISDEELDAYKLREALAGRGILIRTPDGFSFLTNKYFRLAVLDGGANTALLSALRGILPR